MAPRATSLGPKPSLLLFFFRFWFVSSFFAFSFLVLIAKPVFTPKNLHFCVFFCVSLCFSLAFLGPPPFSISLSLSLSCFFLSSFLSVSHFCIWFLIFIFALLALFSFKMLFCFCLSACCLVFFWIIIFHFFVLCILFSIVVVFCFCCFGILFFLFFETYQKTSLKNLEIAKKPKYKMQKKTDILTRAVSTGVLTNSVFFLFCVSLNSAFLLKTL